jgi:hypothetical protein
LQLKENDNEFILISFAARPEASFFKAKLASTRKAYAYTTVALSEVGAKPSFKKLPSETFIKFTNTEEFLLQGMLRYSGGGEYLGKNNKNWQLRIAYPPMLITELVF